MIPPSDNRSQGVKQLLLNVHHQVSGCAERASTAVCLFVAAWSTVYQAISGKYRVGKLEKSWLRCYMTPVAGSACQ